MIASHYEVYIFWFRSTQEIYINIVSGHDPGFQLSVFVKKEYGLNEFAALSGLVSHRRMWSRSLVIHKSSKKSDFSKVLAEMN